MSPEQIPVDWVESHRKLLKDLMLAEKLVKHGKIVLFFQDGKYIGMDACPRERIKVDK